MKCTRDGLIPFSARTMSVSSTGRPASAFTAMVFPVSWRTVVTGERPGIMSCSRPGPPELPGASACSRSPATSASNAEVHWPSSTSIEPLASSASASALLVTATIFTCSPAAVK
ncbi:MAG: hypothetical protein ABSF03_16400 [Streptosporangiaceae bacterium]